MRNLKVDSAIRIGNACLETRLDDGFRETVGDVSFSKFRTLSLTVINEVLPLNHPALKEFDKNIISKTPQDVLRGIGILEAVQESLQMEHL
jgi:hypothetical protein